VKRTDQVFKIVIPNVSSLNEIAAMPIDIRSAAEFENFIQIALDGVKFVRLSGEPGA